MNQLPIPWHTPKKICYHWTAHRLTCEQYDAMHWRAHGRCEICQRPHDRLGVDHDHRLGNTIDHTRGLLCDKCNRAMTYVDNGFRSATPAQQRYIDQAWWRTWLPKELQDEPYTPPTPRNPSSSPDYASSPAYRRRETVGWVFALHPNARR